MVKRYGGVHALRDVDVTIRRGEIHALVGENGAGKSTLGKILAGVVRPDGGTVSVGGRAVHYRAPHEAIRDGIAMIDQELALVPARSVLDNVFLGSEQHRAGVAKDRQARERFRALAARTGFDLDPDAPVGSLRVADQQKVEILRALARNAELIVMDEPTAPLTPDEAQRLHAIMRDLRDRGTTIVFVSHFLREVLALSDTITVLKDGRFVQSGPASEQTQDSLVLAMLGRSLDVAFPDPAPPADDAPVVLRARGLTRAGAIEGVDVTLRAGEIVGIAGLVGSGRTEVARALFGADRIDAGTIELDGRALRLRAPADAIRAGIAMLPESRKEQGLLMLRSVGENITLPHLRLVAGGGVVRRRGESARARELIERLGVKCDGADAPVASLSGGNQQKVALAKWLMKTPRVLIADEPTRGVDVGAKSAIYDLLRGLAAQGVAVLVISSELEEVLGLANRVLVMRRGRVAAELSSDEATDEKVLTAAFGTSRRVKGIDEEEAA
ncbi:simple sugar transport system ATP-binding protein/ribose transport system ATP-binding protein [Conexibacter arvalis]|uniref:Simple sugar transport system ATP-binding protein/ribose transport system ATP-binding protein n=1 Tax=Conexibacter arvalis TaxID=912552 RepID=A0A840IBF3_9ACTN|nr:simple sugar transport system ATP-binding protein/ribose transport system ATP-binding protein [Conexibacter arvalis]